VKDKEQIERPAGPEPGVERARTLAIEASVGARVYRQLFDRESLAEYLRLRRTRWIAW
jgi:hypothetical protein